MDSEGGKNTTSTPILKKLTTATDDESITTSTESDTFDTWTLVTDKNAKKKPINEMGATAAATTLAVVSGATTTIVPKEADDDVNNRVEVLNNDNVATSTTSFLSTAKLAEVMEKKMQNEEKVMYERPKQASNNAAKNHANSVDNENDDYNEDDNAKDEDEDGNEKNADDDDEEDQKKPIESKTDHESTVDDLSDGISIISESESTGRVSPHPFLREHLHNLQFNLAEEFDGVARLHNPTLSAAAMAKANENGASGVRQRLRKRSTSRNSERKQAAERKQLQRVETFVSAMPPMARRAFTGLFYISATLAIIGFISKLHHNEWFPVPVGKPISELELKLHDLELQNNLMRAEIDILSKQVNYISSTKDPQVNARGSGKAGSGSPPPHQQQQQHQQHYERKTKTFKAWSGNGKSLDPVDITKEDLKRPYKCPNGRFVEFAAMCVENKPNEDAFVDKLGNVFEDMLQDPQRLERMKRIAEEVQFLPNPYAESISEPAPDPRYDPVTKHISPDPIWDESRFMKFKDKNAEPAAFDTTKENYNTFKSKPKERGHDSGNHDDDSREEHSPSKCHDNSNERGSPKCRRKHYEPNEHYDDKRRYNSKERSNSKERQNSNGRHNSKERQNSKERHNSDERFNKYEKRKQHSDSKERRKAMDSDEKDGKWHEKLMQQREHARQQNERQRNNKNWYIERGDSREQMRRQ